MENTTEPEGVAAALAAAKAELEELGHTLDVIMFDQLAYQTGIAESAIRKLFAGESVSPEELDPPFKDRLRFLMETRLHPDGRQYTRPELAAAVHVDRSVITNYLLGKRSPSLDTAKDLEKHFKVPGFFTIGPEGVLRAALEPVLDQARFLARLKGQRVEHVALRGSVTAGSAKLQAAIDEVLATAQSMQQASQEEEDEPELLELTHTVRSLPASKRKGVISVLRSAVGLAGKDD